MSQKRKYFTFTRRASILQEIKIYLIATMYNPRNINKAKNNKIK